MPTLHRLAPAAPGTKEGEGRASMQAVDRCSVGRRMNKAKGKGESEIDLSGRLRWLRAANNDGRSDII